MLTGELFILEFIVKLDVGPSLFSTWDRIRRAVAKAANLKSRQHDLSLSFDVGCLLLSRLGGLILIELFRSWLDQRLEFNLEYFKAEQRN